ncbi:hypothetical protein NUW54_g6117 [Trametes sanguinea]|uniref:Uncharacterized protein n=1 Tax=Trametes sanguinea TaxID=158606 RepID=A0ACC1PVW1_9APHY|nr:hypothetical protein NUW54_g6117 [Trametes sanguinea]
MWISRSEATRSLDDPVLPKAEVILPIASARREKGKQRVPVTTSLYDDDLDHSVANTAQPPETTIAAPPAPTTSSLEQQDGGSQLQSKTDTAPCRADDHLGIPNAPEVLPAPSLEVTRPALASRTSSTTAASRKKAKVQEKPWPPAEGIVQPKWAYARTWATEHPSSTRQDFEAHYAAFSPSDKKRITRQYAQKEQKDEEKDDNELAAGERTRWKGEDAGWGHWANV